MCGIITNIGIINAKVRTAADSSIKDLYSLRLPICFIIFSSLSCSLVHLRSRFSRPLRGRSS